MLPSPPPPQTKEAFSYKVPQTGYTCLLIIRGIVSFPESLREIFTPWWDLCAGHKLGEWQVSPIKLRPQ